MRARFAILIAAAALVALAACDSGPRLAATSAPDVLIPVGARLDSERSLGLGGQDEWTGRLGFTVSESSADAFARYHQEMLRFGWRLITSVQAESSVLAFSQGGRVATIQIEGRMLSGATVAITMSPRHSGDASVQVTPLGE